MAHSIEYDDKTGILFVTQVGTVTLETRQQLLKDILAVIPEEGDLKVLSDLREADIVMSHDEAIKYGQLVAQQRRSKRSKIAVVYPVDHDNLYLSETTALLEGDFINVVSFTSMVEAMQWLQQ